MGHTWYEIFIFSTSLLTKTLLPFSRTPRLQSNRYKNFKIPGLEKYTPEQMFFISYGKVWCSKETPDYSLALIEADNHSLNKFRILGPLQNSPEFAQAFKCAPKSRMNPEKKCSLW